MAREVKCRNCGGTGYFKRSWSYLRSICTICRGTGRMVAPKHG